MVYQSHDVIIVGGGVIGLALALMLGRYTSLSVLVLEKNPPGAWKNEIFDHRVSAITLASKYILKNLNVWSEIIQHRIGAFSQIKVWQKKHDVSPLCFDSREIGEGYLGFIIENNLLHNLFYKKIQAIPNVTIVHEKKFKQINLQNNHIIIQSHDNSFYSSKLAVAADGANSWLREQAKIEIVKHDYEEQAIVANLNTEHPHEKIARQIFLQTGPLAFLPLAPEHSSSIVWTLPKKLASEYLTLSDSVFIEKLNALFPHLGIKDITTRYAFPLYKQHVKQYFNERIVLLGDAAHTFHPLAGQGINMGLLDAATLLDTIVMAQNQGKDFTSHYYLRRYERARRADNTALLCSIDMIKYLFNSPAQPVKRLFDFALTTAHYFPWIKNWFSTYAVGKKLFLPKLAERC